MVDRAQSFKIHDVWIGLDAAISSAANATNMEKLHELNA